MISDIVMIIWTNSYEILLNKQKTATSGDWSPKACISESDFCSGDMGWKLCPSKQVIWKLRIPAIWGRSKHPTHFFTTELLSLQDIICRGVAGTYQAPGTWHSSQQQRNAHHCFGWKFWAQNDFTGAFSTILGEKSRWDFFHLDFKIIPCPFVTCPSWDVSESPQQGKPTARGLRSRSHPGVDQVRRWCTSQPSMKNWTR